MRGVEWPLLAQTGRAVSYIAGKKKLVLYRLIGRSRACFDQKGRLFFLYSRPKYWKDVMSYPLTNFVVLALFDLNSYLIVKRSSSLTTVRG